jgi:hypothetical protein
MADFSVQEMANPAVQHYTVAFSDTQDITAALGLTGQKQPRGLYFNAAGNVSITDGNNNTFVYTVTAGQVFPFRAKRVNSTGTTVTAGSVAAWF